MKKPNVRQWILRLMFLGTLSMLAGASTFPDPTRPPGFNAIQTKTTSPQQLQLTAIFIYPTYKVAIVDGQAIKIGDHIGEYTVTNIDLNAVELEGPQNEKETLQLVASIRSHQD